MIAIGQRVKVSRHIRIEMPAVHVSIFPGAEVVILDDSWYENDGLPNNHKIYMVAHQSDSFTTPYHFPVRASSLDLSDFEDSAATEL